MKSNLSIRAFCIIIYLIITEIQEKQMNIEKAHTILQSQRELFDSGATRSLRFRRDALIKLKKAIMANETKIMDALYKDFRKSPFESYASEISLVLKEINYHLRHLKKWSGKSLKPTPYYINPVLSFVRKEPYGLVLIMAPWNYPFGLLMTPLVGAISAGNCVVLKPAAYSSATSAIMEELITSIYLPEYISIFEGGRDVNKVLLEQEYDYIFFTGGPFFGKTVAEAAIKNFTPYTLELGGKNPCIIDKDANLKKTARRLVQGKFFNNGQTCIAPDHLYVHCDIKDRLLQLVKDEITRQFGEDPQKSPDLARLINDKAFERISSYLKNADILIGGQTDKDDRYIAPTLIKCKDETLPIMQEEVFGPVLPVLEFDDLDELTDNISKKDKPLVLYYFTSNRMNIDKVISKINSGGVGINELLVHFVNSHLPFGGVGKSGMGAYHGKYSFNTFSRERALIVSSTLFDIPAKFAPYKKKLRLLKKIL